MKQADLQQLLKENNFKATPKRVEVLSYLAKRKKPVGVDTLCDKFKATNKTTIYRMLEAFVEANILSKHDLGHGHYDYEFSPEKHHHHLVCSKCGQIEEVDLCDGLGKKALMQSSKFAETTGHMVTVFGKCKKCL
jgi:Fe2+ or Zn2+ uptake regulation protein